MNGAARRAIAPASGPAALCWPTRFDLAARQLLSRHVDALRPWLRRDVAVLDAAAIHDFRVALRRLDSSLRLLRPIAAASLLELRGPIHRVFDALGEVRDLDEELRRLEAGEALHAELMRRRRAAVGRLQRELRDTAARRWPGQLSRLLRAQASWSGRLARQPARAVASALVRDRRRRLHRSLDRLDRSAPLARFHRARRRAKRCDDALADFQPWLGDVTRPLRRDIGRLRSALGALQDAVVAERDFEALASGVDADPALRRRARKLADSQAARRRRAKRRALRAADAMPRAHWRRVRKALGPAADFEAGR
jgi:CHAD domain-containing protein